MKAYEVFEIEDFEHDKASNFAPDYGDTVSEGMVYLFVSLWIVIYLIYDFMRRYINSGGMDAKLASLFKEFTTGFVGDHEIIVNNIEHGKCDALPELNMTEKQGKSSRKLKKSIKAILKKSIRAKKSKEQSTSQSNSTF